MVFLLKKAAIAALIAAGLTIGAFNYFAQESANRIRNQGGGGMYDTSYANRSRPRLLFNSDLLYPISPRPGVPCNCQIITNCPNIKPGGNIRGRHCGFQGFQRKICCDDKDTTAPELTDVQIDDAYKQKAFAEIYRNPDIFRNETSFLDPVSGQSDEYNNNNNGQVSAGNSRGPINPFDILSMEDYDRQNSNKNTPSGGVQLDSAEIYSDGGPASYSDVRQPKIDSIESLFPTYYDSEGSDKTPQVADKNINRTGKIDHQSVLARFFPEYYDELVESLKSTENPVSSSSSSSSSSSDISDSVTDKSEPSVSEVSGSVTSSPIDTSSSSTTSSTSSVIPDDNIQSSVVTSMSVSMEKSSYVTSKSSTKMRDQASTTSEPIEQGDSIPTVINNVSIPSEAIPTSVSMVKMVMSVSGGQTTRNTTSKSITMSAMSSATTEADAGLATSTSTSRSNSSDSSTLNSSTPESTVISIPSSSPADEASTMKGTSTRGPEYSEGMVNTGVPEVGDLRILSEESSSTSKSPVDEPAITTGSQPDDTLLSATTESKPSASEGQEGSLSISSTTSLPISSDKSIPRSSPSDVDYPSTTLASTINDDSQTTLALSNSPFQDEVSSTSTASSSSGPPPSSPTFILTSQNNSNDEPTTTLSSTLNSAQSTTPFTSFTHEKTTLPSEQILLDAFSTVPPPASLNESEEYAPGIVPVRDESTTTGSISIITLDTVSDLIGETTTVKTSLEINKDALNYTMMDEVVNNSHVFDGAHGETTTPNNTPAFNEETTLSDSAFGTSSMPPKETGEINTVSISSLTDPSTTPTSIDDENRMSASTIESVINLTWPTRESVTTTSTSSPVKEVEETGTTVFSVSSTSKSPDSETETYAPLFDDSVDDNQRYTTTPSSKTEHSSSASAMNSSEAGESTTSPSLISSTIDKWRDEEISSKLNLIKDGGEIRTTSNPAIIATSAQEEGTTSVPLTHERSTETKEMETTPTPPDSVATTELPPAYDNVASTTYPSQQVTETGTSSPSSTAEEAAIISEDVTTQKTEPMIPKTSTETVITMSSLNDPSDSEAVDGEVPITAATESFRDEAEETSSVGLPETSSVPSAPDTTSMGTAERTSTIRSLEDETTTPSSSSVSNESDVSRDESGLDSVTSTTQNIPPAEDNNLISSTSSPLINVEKTTTGSLESATSSKNDGDELTSTSSSLSTELPMDSSQSIMDMITSTNSIKEMAMSTDSPTSRMNEESSTSMSLQDSSDSGITETTLTPLNSTATSSPKTDAPTEVNIMTSSETNDKFRLDNNEEFTTTTRESEASGSLPSTTLDPGESSDQPLSSTAEAPRDISSVTSSVSPAEATTIKPFSPTTIDTGLDDKSRVTTLKSTNEIGETTRSFDKTGSPEISTDSSYSTSQNTKMDDSFTPEVEATTLPSMTESSISSSTESYGIDFTTKSDSSTPSGRAEDLKKEVNGVESTTTVSVSSPVPEVPNSVSSTPSGLDSEVEGTTRSAEQSRSSTWAQDEDPTTAIPLSLVESTSVDTPKSIEELITTTLASIKEFFTSTVSPDSSSDTEDTNTTSSQLRNNFEPVDSAKSTESTITTAKQRESSTEYTASSSSSISNPTTQEPADTATQETSMRTESPAILNEDQSDAITTGDPRYSTSTEKTINVGLPETNSVPSAQETTSVGTTERTSTIRSLEDETTTPSSSSVPNESDVSRDESGLDSVTYTTQNIPPAEDNNFISSTSSPLINVEKTTTSSLDSATSSKNDGDELTATSSSLSTELPMDSSQSIMDMITSTNSIKEMAMSTDSPTSRTNDESSTTPDVSGTPVTDSPESAKRTTTDKEEQRSTENTAAKFDTEKPDTDKSVQDSTEGVRNIDQIMEMNTTPFPVDSGGVSQLISAGATDPTSPVETTTSTSQVSNKETPGKEFDEPEQSTSLSSDTSQTTVSNTEISTVSPEKDSTPSFNATNSPDPVYSDDQSRSTTISDVDTFTEPTAETSTGPVTSGSLSLTLETTTAAQKEAASEKSTSASTSEPMSSDSEIKTEHSLQPSVPGTTTIPSLLDAETTVPVVNSGTSTGAPTVFEDSTSQRDFTTYSTSEEYATSPSVPKTTTESISSDVESVTKSTPPIEDDSVTVKSAGRDDTSSEVTTTSTPSVSSEGSSLVVPTTATSVLDESLVPKNTDAPVTDTPLEMTSPITSDLEEKSSILSVYPQSTTDTASKSHNTEETATLRDRDEQLSSSASAIDKENEVSDDQQEQTQLPTTIKPDESTSFAPELISNAVQEKDTTTSIPRDDSREGINESQVSSTAAASEGALLLEDTAKAALNTDSPIEGVTTESTQGITSITEGVTAVPVNDISTTASNVASGSNQDLDNSQNNDDLVMKGIKDSTTMSSLLEDAMSTIQSFVDSIISTTTEKSREDGIEMTTVTENSVTQTTQTRAGRLDITESPESDLSSTNRIQSSLEITTLPEVPEMTTQTDVTIKSTSTTTETLDTVPSTSKTESNMAVTEASTSEKSSTGGLSLSDSDSTSPSDSQETTTFKSEMMDDLKTTTVTVDKSSTVMQQPSLEYTSISPESSETTTDKSATSFNNEIHSSTGSVTQSEESSTTSSQEATTSANVPKSPIPTTIKPEDTTARQGQEELMSKSTSVPGDETTTVSSGPNMPRTDTPPEVFTSNNVDFDEPVSSTASSVTQKSSADAATTMNSLLPNMDEESGASTSADQLTSHKSAEDIIGTDKPATTPESVSLLKDFQTTLTPSTEQESRSEGTTTVSTSRIQESTLNSSTTQDEPATKPTSQTESTTLKTSVDDLSQSTTATAESEVSTSQDAWETTTANVVGNKDDSTSQYEATTLSSLLEDIVKPFQATIDSILKAVTLKSDEEITTTSSVMINSTDSENIFDRIPTTTDSLLNEQSSSISSLDAITDPPTTGMPDSSDYSFNEEKKGTGLEMSSTTAVPSEMTESPSQTTLLPDLSYSRSESAEGRSIDIPPEILTTPRILSADDTDTTTSAAAASFPTTTQEAEMEKVEKLTSTSTSKESLSADDQTTTPQPLETTSKEEQIFTKIPLSKSESSIPSTTPILEALQPEEIATTAVVPEEDLSTKSSDRPSGSTDAPNSIPQTTPLQEQISDSSSLQDINDDTTLPTGRSLDVSTSSPEQTTAESSSAKESTTVNTHKAENNIVTSTSFPETTISGDVSTPTDSIGITENPTTSQPISATDIHTMSMTSHEKIPKTTTESNSAVDDTETTERSTRDEISTSTTKSPSSNILDDATTSNSISRKPDEEILETTTGLPDGKSEESTTIKVSYVDRDDQLMGIQGTLSSNLMRDEEERMLSSSTKTSIFDSTAADISVSTRSPESIKYDEGATATPELVQTTHVPVVEDETTGTTRNTLGLSDSSKDEAEVTTESLAYEKDNEVVDRVTTDRSNSEIPQRETETPGEISSTTSATADSILSEVTTTKIKSDDATEMTDETVSTSEAPYQDTSKDNLADSTSTTLRSQSMLGIMDVKEMETTLSPMASTSSASTERDEMTTVDSFGVTSPLPVPMNEASDSSTVQKSEDFTTVSPKSDISKTNVVNLMMDQQLVSTLPSAMVDEDTRELETTTKTSMDKSVNTTTVPYDTKEHNRTTTEFTTTKASSSPTTSQPLTSTFGIAVGNEETEATTAYLMNDETTTLSPSNPTTTSIVSDSSSSPSKVAGLNAIKSDATTTILPSVSETEEFSSTSSAKDLLDSTTLGDTEIPTTEADPSRILDDDYLVRSVTGEGELEKDMENSTSEVNSDTMSQSVEMTIDDATTPKTDPTTEKVFHREVGTTTLKPLTTTERSTEDISRTTESTAETTTWGSVKEDTTTEKANEPRFILNITEILPTKLIELANMTRVIYDEGTSSEERESKESGTSTEKSANTYDNESTEQSESGITTPTMNSVLAEIPPTSTQSPTMSLQSSTDATDKPALMTTEKSSPTEDSNNVVEASTISVIDISSDEMETLKPTGIQETKMQHSISSTTVDSVTTDSPAVAQTTTTLSVTQELPEIDAEASVTTTTSSHNAQQFGDGSTTVSPSSINGSSSKNFLIPDEEVSTTILYSLEEDSSVPPTTSASLLTMTNNLSVIPGRLLNQNDAGILITASPAGAEALESGNEDLFTTEEPASTYSTISPVKDDEETGSENISPHSSLSTTPHSDDASEITPTFTPVTRLPMKNISADTTSFPSNHTASPNVMIKSETTTEVASVSVEDFSTFQSLLESPTTTNSLVYVEEDATKSPVMNKDYLPSTTESQPQVTVISETSFHTSTATTVPTLKSKSTAPSVPEEFTESLSQTTEATNDKLNASTSAEGNEQIENTSVYFSEESENIRESTPTTFTELRDSSSPEEVSTASSLLFNEEPVTSISSMITNETSRITVLRPTTKSPLDPRTSTDITHSIRKLPESDRTVVELVRELSKVKTKITHSINAIKNSHVISEEEVASTTTEIAASTTEIAASTTEIAAGTTEIAANTSEIAATTTEIAATTTKIAATTEIISETSTILSNSERIAKTTTLSPVISDYPTNPYGYSSLLEEPTATTPKVLTPTATDPSITNSLRTNETMTTIESTLADESTPTFDETSDYRESEHVNMTKHQITSHTIDDGDKEKMSPEGIITTSTEITESSVETTSASTKVPMDSIQTGTNESEFREGAEGTQTEDSVLSTTAFTQETGMEEETFSTISTNTTEPSMLFITPEQTNRSTETFPTTTTNATATIRNNSSYPSSRNQRLFDGGSSSDEKNTFEKSPPITQDDEDTTLQTPLFELDERTTTETTADIPRTSTHSAKFEIESYAVDNDNMTPTTTTIIDFYNETTSRSFLGNETTEVGNLQDEEISNAANSTGYFFQLNNETRSEPEINSESTKATEPKPTLSSTSSDMNSYTTATTNKSTTIQDESTNSTTKSVQPSPPPPETIVTVDTPTDTQMSITTEPNVEVISFEEPITTQSNGNTNVINDTITTSTSSSYPIPTTTSGHDENEHFSTSETKAQTQSLLNLYNEIFQPIGPAPVENSTEKYPHNHHHHNYNSQRKNNRKLILEVVTPPPTTTPLEQVIDVGEDADEFFKTATTTAAANSHTRLIGESELSSTTQETPKLKVSVKVGPGPGRPPKAGRELFPTEAKEIEQELNNQISNVVNQLLLTTHENFRLLPSFLECAAASSRKARRKTRVLNFDTDNFPWMARIGYQEPGGLTFSCSGTIISQRYILTSATCARKHEGRITDVLLETVKHAEDTNSTLSQYKLKVQGVYSHPEYDPKSRLNDLALIRLREEIGFNSSSEVRPICLPFEDGYGVWDSLPQPGDIAYLGGWGFEQKNSTKKIADLSESSVKIWSNQNCSRAYAGDSEKRVSSQQLCAYSSRESVCRGDGGAPLMAVMTRHRIFFQIGIVSYGPQCGYQVPRVYTRVSEYLKWILDSMDP